MKTKKEKKLRILWAANISWEIVVLFFLFILLDHFWIKVVFLILWGIRMFLLLGSGWGIKKGSEHELDSSIDKFMINKELGHLEKIDNEKAKYLALQNQINPHFLYNTLEGIRSEALLGGVPTAAKMSELLANFFRYNISNVDKMVTVEDELRNVKNYFKIQEFRFEDRIRMEVIFEEGEEIVRKSKMPKLILQPIIENAILHGIEPLIGPGKVTIRFVAYENRLLIIVSDNGVGINPDKLEELNQKFRGEYLEESSEEEPSTGIGVVNVNNRIRLLFGDDYGLRFFSKEQIGTDVEISLPLQLRG